MGIKYRKNGKNGRLTAQERRLVNHRLRVIKMAAKLGNVSAACRIGNMDRPSFYKYKRRYDLYGISGLRNLSTAPHHRHGSIKSKFKHKIVSLALKHTRFGCRPIASMLAAENILVSHETVRNLLVEEGLNTIAKRQKYTSQKQNNVVLL